MSERIRREARVVGLRGFRTPSLEAVERRRMQLWIVTTILLVGVSVGTAIVSLWAGSPLQTWLTPSVLRASVVLLSIGFCAYAIEKELHLRKLARLLIDERVLTAAFSNRLREVSVLLEAGKAMNSVLDLRSVLDIILGGALDLLSGKSGSILLRDGDQLRAGCVRGNDQARDRRIRLGEGIAGHVALSREPLLINGEADPADFPGLAPHEQYVDSAMCVPLVNRDELLGVLNVNADPDREFTEYDLRALSLFAEQAASAIANARLFEAERSHVAELLELDRLKSDFVALVSHELRTPLTSILAAAKTAQRPEMQDQNRELVHIIERQSRRLSSMVEDLLTAARLEQELTLPPLAEVDLGALVRLAARDFEVTDRPVEVEAPESVRVLGDPEALRRILDNLLDNAHKHGSPPIRVTVEERPDGVVLSVVDGGPGVPAEDRERVFERFYRLNRRPQPGLGLGLPIVRGLVSSCGGSIWIEEAAEGGAAFRVALPSFETQREAV